MKQNFSLSGFPDFTSMEIARRQYVLSKIKDKFNCFGFLPISTSILEKRSNLVDSYGDDGDKLIFQILRSGDYLSKLQLNTKKLSSKDLSELISDKSLRYDLTVPFARFTAKNQSQITFPFKRYEIGYVFRADRPQRGRFRQFIQCDADIIGSRSLWLEIDLINLINSVFTSLSLKDIVIKISNRKVLEGIFNSFTTPLSFTEFCIIIDKLDKINIDKVGEILLEKEFLKEDVMFLKNLFSFKGSFEEKKKFILSKVTLNNTLETGFNELTFILDRIPLLNQLIDID